MFGYTREVLKIKIKCLITRYSKEKIKELKQAIKILKESEDK